MLAIICFAILLVIQAFLISKTQLDYQDEMMSSVSQAILKELTQVIDTQKLQMALFYSENRTTLNQFIASPKDVTEQQYVQLLDDIKQVFPTSRLFTLVAATGENLLEHITGAFLDDCNQEVKETVSVGTQKGLFLHRSSRSAHYDLIQAINPTDTSRRYFFVAFNIDFISELLKKYQLPYQRLYLLREDKKGLIEVSSTFQLASQFNINPEYLSAPVLNDFEHSLKIPNTRWKFAIRLDPDAKSRLMRVALFQSLLTWSIVTLLLYLALYSIGKNLKSKIRVERELAQSKKKEKLDRLTGLYNRQYLEFNIQRILDNKNHKGLVNNGALILIDFDKFKLLNSSHGFQAGDEFLKRIALLMQDILPVEFEISRLSSDEFAVTLTGIDKTHLQQVCNLIKTSINEFKFQWQQDTISTSVCLGVVIIDQSFTNINQVLSAADHACRLAKSKGINTTQYYQTDDPDIKKRTEEINVLSAVKKAIYEDRLVLYAQEIRAIDPLSQASQPKKYELLLRMFDPDGQMIPPNHFIPAAEKYGVMEKIDWWVLRNSFKQIATLSSTDDAYYSINISSKTLSDKGIIDFVEALFSEFSVSGDRINFEVTETSAISYLNHALDFMAAMKARGCQFSLDDFGTGLASFDHLRKLPIDHLKIDGIFIRDIDTNPNDLAFVEAIHKMSSQLGIKTVAEFVENDTIFKLLNKIGIDYAQGYFIHKPALWYQPEKSVQ